MYRKCSNEDSPGDTDTSANKSQKVFLHENKHMFVPTCSQVQLAHGYVANTACRSRVVHAV